MNLEQWQRSKKIKAEAEAAAKRTVERVLNTIKEPAMSEFKVGQEIKGKFKNFFGEEVVVDGRIREIKHGVLCCNEISSGRPFFVHPKEVEVQSENLGDDSHIENHISPLCKSKDV
ncbi:hypothetical protein QQA06_10680 [Acinetobacter baumannii]|uniref:hypothetical protein n=2 Tax=Acinetobacter calcoaceticus/baumannii complex TaxID=909768 RepID=UPI001651EA7E|nr:hypothetical protein [Acinetobacter baumannii]EKV2265907.1 hypothetical protein [Acinetobacter baumannii]MBC6799778.1 hypothetical protein [Acinetobacter baumannii]MBO2809095.1 hypothetical protein [Acinetobacter baumannii]MBO2867805.1 hypothetical protein [Acinetobacter baumannii]MBO2999411.1 hypothetical protein [Acinetobacter baumannii]